MTTNYIEWLTWIWISKILIFRLIKHFNVWETEIRNSNFEYQNENENENENENKMKMKNKTFQCLRNRNSNIKMKIHSDFRK